MQNDVVELVSQGDWLLGAENLAGRVIESRLFIVTELSLESLPNFVIAISKINQSGSLGRGYLLQAFDEPCVGCEVTVKPGWELSSTAMKEDFLSRFLKALELELSNDSNTSR